MKTIALARVAGLVAALAPAAAEEAKPSLKDRVADGIKDKLGTLKTTEPEQRTASGCILSETFNTQSVSDYSMQFRLMTSSGPEMFNFTGTHLMHADPASFPLATRDETLRWTRIMDARERAAMRERPIDVQYELPSRRVFGVTIRWNERRPAS